LNSVAVPETARQPLDLLTVIAIALVAYAIANFLHEGVGHGGACLAVGGTPQVLSSVHFECDLDASATTQRRILAAGGTMVNLIVGAFSLLVLKGIPAAQKPHSYYFFWLFATLNLLMGAGYFMFSGVGNIGDWSVFAKGLWSPLVWRPAFAVFGIVFYFLLARRLARALRPLIGDNEHSSRRARQFTLPAYFAGGLLYCISGLFNPLGPYIIAISAAAASFGGASGLLWLTALLRHFRGEGDAAALARRYDWIGAGIVLAIIFVLLLGPGIHF